MIIITIIFLYIYVYTYVYPPAPLWGTTAVRVIADILSLCDNCCLQSLSCSKLSVYSSHCPVSAVSNQCTVYSVQYPSFNGSPPARFPWNSPKKKVSSRAWAPKPLQNTIRERLAAQIHCKYKCLSVRSPPRMHHPDIGPSTFDYKTTAKRPSSVRSPSPCHRSIFAYLIKIMHFTKLSQPSIKPTK